jgi:hypothetical protein
VDEAIGKVISFLEDRSISAKLVFGNKRTISKVDPEDKRRRTKTKEIHLTYSRLADDVVEEYRQDFLRQVQYHQDDTRMRYNGSDVDPAGYQYYRVADIPNEASITNEPKEQLSEIDDEFIKTMMFTIFRFENWKNKELLVIRVYPRSKFLKKKDGLILRGGVLSFTTSDIVAADRVMDCLIFEDEVIIFHRKAFEKIFDFKNIFKKHLDKVFAAITEDKVNYKIEQLPELKEAILKDMRKLRKLTSITEKEVYKTVSFENIMAFDKDYHIGAEIDGSKRSIKFLDAFSFLHFYNDDNLYSQLTKIKYLAFSKIAKQ